MVGYFCADSRRVEVSLCNSPNLTSIRQEMLTAIVVRPSRPLEKCKVRSNATIAVEDDPGKKGGHQFGVRQSDKESIRSGKTRAADPRCRQSTRRATRSLDSALELDTV